MVGCYYYCPHGIVDCYYTGRVVGYRRYIDAFRARSDGVNGSSIISANSRRRGINISIRCFFKSVTRSNPSEVK